MWSLYGPDFTARSDFTAPSILSSCSDTNQSAERNRFILLTQRCFSFCRRSKREGGLEGVGTEPLSLEAKRIRLGRRDRASRILSPIIVFFRKRNLRVFSQMRGRCTSSLRSRPGAATRKFLISLVDPSWSRLHFSDFVLGFWGGTSIPTHSSPIHGTQ